MARPPDPKPRFKPTSGPYRDAEPPSSRQRRNPSPIDRKWVATNRAILIEKASNYLLQGVNGHTPAARKRSAARLAITESVDYRRLPSDGILEDLIGYLAGTLMAHVRSEEESESLAESLRLLDGEGDAMSWRSIARAGATAVGIGAAALGLPSDTGKALQSFGSGIATALTGRDPVKGQLPVDAPPEPAPMGGPPPRRMRPLRARTALGSGVVRSSESEFESGWDVAVRRSAGTPALSPQHASEARKRIRAAAAPAFAAALERGVDAGLLTRFAARHPGGVDAGKLRAAFAEAANRAFAAEFVRLVGGRPPASAEDLALGAVIAVAIAQTTGRFPIVPPAAVAPMAVLVHRALRPQLAQLARMAAVIAAAPAAPAPRPIAPAREMAW